MTPLDDNRALSVDWDFQIQINGQASSWRDRLGRRLRMIAQQIDGRTTLGIRITTFPDIGSRKTQDCIRHGLTAMKQAVASEVSAEAQEILFRRAQPYLFEDSEANQLIALAPDDGHRPSGAYQDHDGL